MTRNNLIQVQLLLVQCKVQFYWQLVTFRSKEWMHLSKLLTTSGIALPSPVNCQSDCVTCVSSEFWLFSCNLCVCALVPWSGTKSRPTQTTTCSNQLQQSLAFNFDVFCGQRVYILQKMQKVVTTLDLIVHLFNPRVHSSRVLTGFASLRTNKVKKTTRRINRSRRRGGGGGGGCASWCFIDGYFVTSRSK